MRPGTWIAVGALSGALAIACGAFGAHALRMRLDAAQLDIWKTAVLYHALHALALVLFGLFRGRFAATDVAGWAFLAGTALFSGSLYLLAVTGQRWLGAVTPLGGIAFLLGWLVLAWQAWRGRG
jgi:uncharacterized membrane protein YgdD (TMEM256/DUF423 family)